MTFQTIIEERTGELKPRASRALFLDFNEYRVFNNVALNTNPRTNQIDHIIVSRYGIFVVDTKNRDGWIYGHSHEPEWTEVVDGDRKVKFQNPLRQNDLHAKNLSEALEIDRALIFSVVVFWGKCQFKTMMPENVLKSSYTNYIKTRKLLLLDDPEVERVCKELYRIKVNTLFPDGKRHIQRLKRQYQAISVDGDYQRFFS